MRLPANIKSITHLHDHARELDKITRLLYTITQRMIHGPVDEQLMADFRQNRDQALKLIAKIGFPGLHVTHRMRAAPTLYDTVEKWELQPMVEPDRGSFQFS